MKRHLSNAAWGVLEYAAYPIGMLALAPVMLRNLGLARYGVWTFATAAVGVGAILAAGFGDANIQLVASRRGEGGKENAIKAVRSLMGINLALGAAFAIAGWMLSPLAAAHVAASDAGLLTPCLWSLRIASALMLMRALESVCVSTQRAFERYGAAVRASIVARLLGLATAAGLTFASSDVALIMAASALPMLAGLCVQLAQLRRMLSARSLLPSFDREAMRALLGFGAFCWLQAVAGIVFSQVDRLFLGVSLGAAAVTSYALCAQMAQPIFGVAASGLHFLFPYLSHRKESSNTPSLRNPVLVAFACNLAFVAAAAGALLLFGSRILRVWAGPEIALGAAPVMTLIVASSALLGLNVTATYALLALKRVRVVTFFNLAGGAIMLLIMLYLTPRLGIEGVAIARLSYALVPLGLYIPLLRHLFRRTAVRGTLPALQPIGEER